MGRMWCETGGLGWEACDVETTLPLSFVNSELRGGAELHNA